MQRVIHSYRNKSYIFNIIEGLYAYLSDTEYMFQQEDVLWLDDSFKELSDILNRNLMIYNVPKFKQFDFTEISTRNPNRKEVVLCLSGGKDSAAAAVLLRHMGYIVHLYHVVGVNKAYGDEQKAAQRIAKYLDCDLYIDKIQLSGTHRFIEHPLKNYIIANGALHYALYRGYRPLICFGNFSQSYLADNAFEVCGGDCIEMWDAYKTIIRRVIPNFDILIPLKSNADTFSAIEDDWVIFNACISCMSPYRFRAHWKRRTEQRYGISLFDNRCGCCWKCCIEEMWLMDTDKKPLNEEYYLHCVEILWNTVYKERGYYAEDIYELWNTYMFYPIEQSKLHHTLINMKLKGN